MLGAIDFGLENTPPGGSHSLFVARSEDSRNTVEHFSNAVPTYNEATSHSGWGTATDAGVSFRVGSASGSHWASALHMT